MATATTYTLRLTPPPPPPRHHAPLLPQLRRRAAAKVSASWVPAGGGNSDDGLGGWWLPEQPAEKGRAGFGKAIVVGLGASAAIALAGITWRSPSSRKCLQQLIGAPLHYVQEKLSVADSTEIPEDDASVRELGTIDVSRVNVDERNATSPDDSSQNHIPAGGVRISFTVPVDPMHEEALSILKKLQIIENDASPGDFCTRREFARWFVKLCSKLERKRMHRIIPNLITSGSVGSAFDDVNFDDPDFLYIQSLGESGIVPSKLSSFFGTSANGSQSANRNSHFLPESYLSRFDLVNWKLLVEYPFASELDQKMLSKNVHTLDLSAWPDVTASVFMDLFGGDHSIVSKVFGNTRRLQHHKPVTKAQAAAALTSGRMEEVVPDELNRLEVENQSRLSAVGEMMEELINRGDIKQYWEDKMKKEQDRGFEVEKHLQDVLHELANERMDQEKEIADLLKEKSALERQNQELVCLRSEVDGMYDRLATQSLEIMADEENLEKLSSDMSSKHQAVTEAKSYLEAEKEALTMLRSWVEQEAARVHERAEVLERAVRRWRVPAD
ncbi:uncharacterized protein LOC119337180 [Triticum dicoccoides]|uniref:uncharacterized protein LOC119337180 n=1 Tax=Triticum dicoccoides TaxID=85692 RepID=UPI001891BF58|nr:uncharacterized protein LOC119337180 [Triticum dicoccoides]